MRLEIRELKVMFETAPKKIVSANAEDINSCMTRKTSVEESHTRLQSIRQHKLEKAT